MESRTAASFAALISTFAVIFTAAPSSAGDVQQLLDQVHVFNPTSVLEMQFDDPARTSDFDIVLNNATANFSACKITAGTGLWCLNGNDLLRWPNPADAATFENVLSCADPALDLDARHGVACTSMTVDSTGAIYLAGRAKSKLHNLIKIVPAGEGGVCEAGFFSLSDSPDYCAHLVATGRPLLIDISPIDGDLATNFNPNCPSCAGSGKGTLGLEARTDAAFYPDIGPTVDIVGGKSGWGLQGNEQVQSVALFQLPNMSDGFDSYVLATTSKDRVLAAETDGTPDTIQVFDIAASRDPASAECAAGNEHYGIRASSKSGTVYVTDRNYCQVLALEAVVNASGKLTQLVNAQESGSDLTLATADGADVFPPDFPTLAPGTVIDLSQCTTSCTLVNGVSGNPAAVLSNVTLVGTESGMTLFQIQGMPDCRYIPLVCVDLLDNVNSPADLITEGVIIDPSGTDTVEAQLLNLTPLLPKEITDLFPDGLPDMWVPRWYHAQPGNGYLIDAFFGLTDASFEGVSQLELNIADLTGGTQLGCPTTTPPNNTPVEELLKWDVAIKVSEKVVSIDRADIPNPDHEATLITNGCGSTMNGMDRWSLLPVDMQVSANSWNDLTSVVTTDDDAIFAKLLLSLFDDLRDAASQLACQAVDGQSFAPLSVSDCSSLDNQWLNAKDKLDKCIEAAKEPKTSLRNQNCQAFESQLSNLGNDLSMLTVSGEDPANRIGELNLRYSVIDNLYFNLFFPSIPDEGFGDF